MDFRIIDSNTLSYGKWRIFLDKVCVCTYRDALVLCHSFMNSMTVSPDKHIMLTIQGAVHSKWMAFDKAIKLFKEARIAAAEEHNAQKLIVVTENIATCYAKKGNVVKAKRVFVEALQLVSKNPNMKDNTIYHSRINAKLANMFRDNGCFVESEMYYDLALLGFENDAHNTIISKMDVLIDKLLCFRKQGLFDTANRILNVILQNKLDENTLAFVYDTKNDYVQAEVYYRNAIQLKEANITEDYWKVITLSYRLARIYIKQTKYDESANLLERCLSIGKEFECPDSMSVVLTLELLARLYIFKRNLSQASTIFDRMYKIQNKFLGGGHSETCNTLKCIEYFRKIENQTASRIDEDISRILNRNLPEYNTGKFEDTLNCIAFKHLHQEYYNEWQIFLNITCSH